MVFVVLKNKLREKLRVFVDRILWYENERKVTR